MTRPARLAAQGLAVALVIGLLALLVWRVANDNTKGVAQALKDGSHPTAPAFDLSRLDGRGRFDLASLRGKKPIVLDFWASWCVPCIHESKRLEAARNQPGALCFEICAVKQFWSHSANQQKFFNLLKRRVPGAKRRIPPQVFPVEAPAGPYSSPIYNPLSNIDRTIGVSSGGNGYPD